MGASNISRPPPSRLWAVPQKSLSAAPYTVSVITAVASSSRRLLVFPTIRLIKSALGVAATNDSELLPE